MVVVCTNEMFGLTSQSIRIRKCHYNVVLRKGWSVDGVAIRHFDVM